MATGMHVRSYDGTSAPRLADFGGVVWMLAAARAKALDRILRRRVLRGSVQRWFLGDQARERTLRVAGRDA